MIYSDNINPKSKEEGKYTQMPRHPLSPARPLLLTLECMRQRKISPNSLTRVFFLLFNEKVKSLINSTSQHLQSVSCSSLGNEDMNARCSGNSRIGTISLNIGNFSAMFSQIQQYMRSTHVYIWQCSSLMNSRKIHYLYLSSKSSFLIKECRYLIHMHLASKN